MKTQLIEELKSAVKNWWMSLILGILFIGIALLLMFYPLASYIALSIMFSVCMFIAGILEITFSLSNRRRFPSWGWYLAGGIIDLLLGFFLMLYPGLNLVIIPYIMAFWLMFRGFSAIGFALDLNRFGTKNWGWYLVFGILAILCSLIILWQPAAGAFSIVYIMAFAFLFIGVFRVMLAFDLRDLHKNSQKLHEEINKLKQMENL